MSTEDKSFLIEEIPNSIDFTKVNDFIYLAGKAKHFGHLVAAVVRELTEEEKRPYSVEEITERIISYEPSVFLNTREVDFLNKRVKRELVLFTDMNERPQERDIIRVRENDTFYASSTTKLRAIVASLLPGEKEELIRLLTTSPVPMFGTSITQHKREN